MPFFNPGAWRRRELGYQAFDNSAPSFSSFYVEIFLEENEDKLAQARVSRYVVLNQCEVLGAAKL